MLLKPLILGVSIDLGLLAVALTLRFIIYPFYCIWCNRRQAVDKDLEKTIEIKIDGSNHYEQYIKI